MLSIKNGSTNNAVKIDPEGLPGRLIKLPLQAGNYDNFYSDGKKVWYASGRSTKVYDLTEQKRRNRGRRSIYGCSCQS